MAAQEVSAGLGDSCPLPSREGPAPPTLCRSWLVLLACSLNSAFNAFVCVDFSVVSSLTEEVLDVSKDVVAWLYSGMLLTTFVGMPISLALIVQWEAAGLWFSVVANVASAAVRWIGVRRRSYALSLASALLSGFAASVILLVPAQLSEQRFPPPRWSFTTSLAVQANYGGWMIGSIVVPWVVHDLRSMEAIMFYQTAFSAVVVVVFAVCYRPVAEADAIRGRGERVAVFSSSFLGSGAERLVESVLSLDCDLGRAVGSAAGAPSASAPRCADGGARPGGGRRCEGLRVFLEVVRAYPSLGMQILACGTLGGVSYTLPGCIDPILACYGFRQQLTGLLNLSFMASGVSSGLLLGYKCKDPAHYGVVLKVIFYLCVIALTLLAALIELGHPSEDSPLHLASIFALTMVAGATSLGFLGVGIEACALFPAGGTYVCFSIELLVQLIGSILSQMSSNKDGFLTIAGAAWLAALLFRIGHPRPQQQRDLLNSA